MRNRLNPAAVLLCICAACAGCGDASRDSAATEEGARAGGVVAVFGAASTTNALSDLCAAYERERGVRIVANFASSSTLAQQVVNGAEADLFLSANVRWADAVQREGLAASRVDLLGNSLVVIVPADSRLEIATVENLKTAPIRRLAIADPSCVPAGIYAKQALENLGLWSGLEAVAAAGADVRQALAYVEQGAADAGIVYATDAAISDRVKVAAEIPSDACPPIVYPLMLLRQAGDNGDARSFYEYLQSAEAAEIFEKYGFLRLGTAREGAP